MTRSHGARSRARTFFAVEAKHIETSAEALAGISQP
jgi:hypothetical protein